VKWSRVVWCVNCGFLTRKPGFDTAACWGCGGRTVLEVFPYGYVCLVGEES
jgi:hypothetical protein